MYNFFSFALVSFILFSCGNRAEPTTAPPTIANTQTITPAIKPVEERENPYVPVDVSPMDMSYFPADYPKLKMAKKTTSPPLARVVYSRPHLQGRHIFHELLKYGEPWRLGANECTEIEFFKPAIIQGKKIKAGRYIIYCIPQEDKWTIVLNSNIDCWCYLIDQTKDVARFDVSVTKTNNSLEYFTMLFQTISKGCSLLIAWDDVEVRMPIQF
ncbi:MAG: hypothetical protein RIR12_2324 [Bacteroidota bacterium]|jgi:hypothetical protein